MEASVPFADLTLTVDGMKYEVSRYALAKRSQLLRAIFESEEPADGVQDAWAGAPKGPQSTFALLLEALYTGVADMRLPQALLDYFMTVDVTYGWVLVRAYTNFREYQYRFIRREYWSQDGTNFLEHFHNKPGSFVPWSNEMIHSMSEVDRFCEALGSRYIGKGDQESLLKALRECVPIVLEYSLNCVHHTSSCPSLCSACTPPLPRPTP